MVACFRCFASLVNIYIFLDLLCAGTLKPLSVLGPGILKPLQVLQAWFRCSWSLF